MDDKEKMFIFMVEQIRNYVIHCLGFQPEDMDGGEFNNHFIWKTNNSEPINPKFRAKEVFFGGSTSYDSSYWDSLRQVYSWANSLLISFDWEVYTLIFQNWW